MRIPILIGTRASSEFIMLMFDMSVPIPSLTSRNTWNFYLCGGSAVTLHLNPVGKQSGCFALDLFQGTMLLPLDFWTLLRLSEPFISSPLLPGAIQQSIYLVRDQLFLVV
jgi:hypothetical protein